LQAEADKIVEFCHRYPQLSHKKTTDGGALRAISRLASHCIRRLETGSFERNCFGQENLPKSLFQKSNFSRLNAEGIPAF